MNKKIFAIFVLIFALISSTSVQAGLFDSLGGSSDSSSDLQVENLNLTSQGYGTYNVVCDVTPKKDYEYLRMVVVYYDSNGAVLNNNTWVWSQYKPQKDQTIRASGVGTVYNNQQAATAEVFFVDSYVDDKDQSDAIYIQNVTL